MIKSRSKNLTLRQSLPFILTIGSILGLLSSSMLIYDQVKIWQNPAYAPSCNINPVLACGSIISSGEGKVLGIPGPFIGLVVFAALATVGTALLAGAKLKRWFWIGLQAGVSIGAAVAVWMFWLSLYRIHALCPFCLGVDVVVYTIFWYVTLYNLQEKHIVLPTKLQILGVLGRRYHGDILGAWLLIVSLIILTKFWYYWKTLIN
jgi:uncharacterized membrane protein